MLVAVVACLLAGGAVPASAADGRGLLRVAHLSPDTPAVDVALAPLPEDDDTPLADPGPDVADGLAYGDVGPYQELAPGSYAVSVRTAGAGPEVPPSLSLRIELPAGAARTVALSGSFAALALTVVPDDLSAPGRGGARVRVLAAAAAAPSLDVMRTGGPELARDLPFGTAGRPVTVPAGASAVRLDGAPGGPVGLPVDLPAGSVSSLLVLDRPEGGLTARVVLDAAGPAVVPTGPVPAGSGGATRAALVVPPAVLAAAGLLALGSRRRAVLTLVAALAAVPVPLPSPTPTSAGPSAAASSSVPRSVARPPEVVPGSSREVAAPVRLRIPTAGVDTAVSGIGLTGSGVLVPPLREAGWFAQGPAPGAPGPAVITGHVDGSTGPAVFFRLRDVAPGDPVVVTRADGSTVEFVVTRVESVAKDAFPTAEVYGPTAGPELRLITCGGEFDPASGSYRDNVVVHAR